MENQRDIDHKQQNRQFIDIAKQALKRGFDEQKIFKILRKEGLFDEEIDQILFMVLEELRAEQFDINLVTIKDKNYFQKDNRLFKSVILEIIISIIAFLIFPFRIPPSKALKKFSLFVILVLISWTVYSLFMKTDSPQTKTSEKELLQQLKTIQQLQKDFQ